MDADAAIRVADDDVGTEEPIVVDAVPLVGVVIVDVFRMSSFISSAILESVSVLNSFSSSA